jgi:two-component system phosphate regulon sensor histidine kinase PhoR
MQIHRSLRLLSRQLSRSRGLVLRGLLCWAIGCVILLNDELNSYDSRLQLRGGQTVSSQIVLITLRPSDMISSERNFGRAFGPLSEVTDITDSFYWDPKIWSELLKKVLAQKPKKVGVTLFFSENLGPLSLTAAQSRLLTDPRVIWGTATSLSERINQPLLSDDLRSNVGTISLLRDEDGVIRRTLPNSTDLVHRLTKTASQSSTSRLINYRVPTGKFVEFSVRDILDQRVPDSVFRNKYVLIGAESPSSTQYLTPLGPSQRHEVFAQILDNQIEKRWIHRAGNLFYMIFLLLPLMILSVSVMTGYPQTVAFVFMFWLATLNAAISAWVFDLFYIWIPAVSSGMQLLATWVLFTGYQANKIERQNWQLQQEQLYLAELEQLKNNFVSLISHDLKTPIAKIQAIVDRLMTDPANEGLARDLKSLRMSSDELNHYIQSILKVLRVESRDFQLNKEVGDINDTIQEALDQLRPLALEKRIQIETHLEPMFSIEVDFTLMREVLINLLENAIKYTSQDGRITVASREVNNKIWVEIQDTGEGIPSEELANVWGKFVRGKDQDLKTKGTGLGLYLVKYFIELHGGEVFLESELRKGTKVSFSLPLEDSEGVA